MIKDEIEHECGGKMRRDMGARNDIIYKCLDCGGQQIYEGW